MVLTKEEEEIVKAEIALKIAKTKARTESVLMHEEIRAQHAPITEAVMLAHKPATDALKKKVADASLALSVLFK